MNNRPSLIFKKICAKAIPVVEKASIFIAEHAGKIAVSAVETKSRNSLVSFVDKHAEQILVGGLKEIIPDSAFITEENTVENSDGQWQWIIDPLDGTTNYLHNIPFYAVSVALRYNQKTIVGIVHHVTTGEMFYAWKGGGAYLNGEPISVSHKETADSLLATGFPYYDFEYIDEYMRVLKELMQITRGLRRCGSAALDIAYVAAGRFDIFFEYGLHPWDVAAGAILVKEAGGIVSNFEGEDQYLFSKQIIAGNPTVYTDVQALINKHMTMERNKLW